MERIYRNNRSWAEQVRRDNPDFFEGLSQQQAPDYLWIGCADSRVPANQIVDLPAGEVFVHRNIANVVVPTDLNCLSVLQYAVEVLKVRVIIVCGHYGCGGIRAALEDKDHGLIDNWLNHIRAVRRIHASSFEGDLSLDEAADKLCEINVLEQVNNVCNTTIVRNAWAGGHNLEIHGVVYSLTDGILHPLCKRTGPDAPPCQPAPVIK